MKKMILALTLVLLFLLVTACSGGEQNWDGTFYQYLDDHRILAFTFEKDQSDMELRGHRMEIIDDNGVSRSGVSIWAQLKNKTTAEDDEGTRYILKGDKLEVKYGTSGDFYGSDFSGTYTRGDSVEKTFGLDNYDDGGMDDFSSNGDLDDDDNYGDDGDYGDDDPLYTSEIAILVVDFGDDPDDSDKPEYLFEYEGPLDISILSYGLSTTTGLDFFVDGEIEESRAFVSWHDESTLVGGLDDRQQSEEFFFYDAVSLNWFMMDSLAATIKMNFPEVTEVYYSGEDGEPVAFPNPEDMASQGLPVLPVDMPYEGSAFFIAHSGMR